MRGLSLGVPRVERGGEGRKSAGFPPALFLYFILEPLVGVEPTTPALQVRCSAGLSYSGDSTRIIRPGEILRHVSAGPTRYFPRAARAESICLATTAAKGCASLTSLLTTPCRATVSAAFAKVSAFPAPAWPAAAAAFRAGMMPFPCPWHTLPEAAMKALPCGPSRQLITWRRCHCVPPP